ncbi:MAG: hypothetical protein ACRCVG_04000 [Methanobacteriaceae archaeon]
MVELTISTEMLIILAVAVLLVITIIIVVFQWSKVKRSQSTVKLMDKEIELKKIAMVEKDLESKRLMENQIPLPKDQQEHLSQIRQSTSGVMNEVGFLHSEINERLARLEAATEQKKLAKILNEIEKKEKELQKKK